MCVLATICLKRICLKSHFEDLLILLDLRRKPISVYCRYIKICTKNAIGQLIQGQSVILKVGRARAERVDFCVLCILKSVQTFGVSQSF